jgi:hypothetical protein
MPEKIAARYIGGHTVSLPGSLGPYFDASGKPIASYRLNYGDTLMMPAHEVLGQTYLRQHDQAFEHDQVFDLGAGRVVRPQDQNKSPEELAAIGYEFHRGRPDFEPYTSPSPEPALAEQHDAEEA